MQTTMNEVGIFLEEQAKLKKTIFYSDVTRKFPDLPPLGPHWKSHPLCSIFGELDHEDNLKERPLRTACVVSRETGRPGQGLFDTIENLRNQTILKTERYAVWARELNAVFEYYR